MPSSEGGCSKLKDIDIDDKREPVVPTLENCNMEEIRSSRKCNRKELWPWIILACAATNVIFLGGKRRAFGVFVAQLHVEFHGTVSLAELNWIGDSYAALGYLTTTISSTAILMSGRRYKLFQTLGSLAILLACVTSAYVPNPHWLFLTHTLFHGIGSSLILSSVGLIVNEHFDKQHPYHILATTLVSGGSIASIVFVQLYAYLIEQYTWRNAFLILGVLYFFINMTGAFIFTKNEDLPDYSNPRVCFQKTLIDGEKPKTLLLVLWFIDRIFTSVVTYGLLMNLADYVRRRESSLTKSSHLTLLFASGEASTYALGALITAMTQDFLKGKLKYLLCVTSFGLACSLIFWEVVAANEYLSYCLAFVCGFFMGPSVTFLFPAGEELTTLPGHIAYPFSLAGMGMGMALSPSLTGMIAERYEYRYFFLIQGFMIFIKFICLAAIIFLLKFRYADNNGYQIVKQVEIPFKDSNQDLTVEMEMNTDLAGRDVGRRGGAIFHKMN